MTPRDVLRGAPALCDPRGLRPWLAPRQRGSYSPCFHPTQVTPQEMHTREISWLLFIHKKTQRPTSKPYQHPPMRCGPLSLAVLSFFLAGRLGLGTAALCAGSRVAGSKRPDSRALILNATRWPLQGGSSRSRVGSFLRNSLQPMVPSMVSSLLAGAG